MQKVLISSTSRFTGEFDNVALLLTHAWDGLWRKGVINEPLGEASRNAFVCAFQTVEQEP